MVNKDLKFKKIAIYSSLKIKYSNSIAFTSIEGLI